MHRRLLPINTRLLVLIVAMALPFVGAYEAKAALIPSGIAIIVFGVFQRRAANFDRPELWVFFALLGTEVAIGSAVTMAGLQRSGALVMLCRPATGVCGRFRS